MDVSRRGKAVTANTIGLDQLDIYVNGHPAGTPVVLGDEQTTTQITVPADAREVEVVGFSTGVVRQRRRL
jgi:hypothetical protein